jgi:hypothetical protein
MFGARPPGALASANANWATGVEAVLPANAYSSPGVFLSSVSCPSAGNCTAVDTYWDSSFHNQGVMLTETSGTWATGVEAGLPAGAIGSDLNTVSCPSAGNCAAVGSYFDSSLDHFGLLLSQSSGTWATGVTAGLPAGAASNPSVSLNAVSCASAGDCAAVGTYTDSSGHQQGLLLTETAGTWATGVTAGLPAAASNPNVHLGSVSCASAGNCVAVGSYTDSSGNQQGLLLSQTSGTWATGVKAGLPAAASNPNVHLGSVFCSSFGNCSAVSCASAGNCSAVGYYTDSSGNQQGLLLTETAGAWATGVEAMLPPGAASNPTVQLTAVSCPSAGNCGVVGAYTDSSGNTQGVLLTETAGTWATGVEAGLPANAGSNPFVAPFSVSCASAGNCGAVGNYGDSSGNQQGLLLTETSGTWATGEEAGPPANAASSPTVVNLISVSCPSADNCAAVGEYNDISGTQQGLLLSAAPAGPTVSASAPASATPGSPISASSISAALAGGSAATGTVTFTVFGPQSAPPVSCASGGTAVGSASVSGDGTYHPSAGFTPASPGDYWWFASYSGDPSDNPTASACGAAMPETVVPPGPTVVPASPKPGAPALSGVRLGSKRFAAKKGTTLKLTVSQPAQITVLITQTVKGHKVKGVCKRHAKTGKRCTTTITKRTLTFSAGAGANHFKLKLPGLANGAYTATITAQNANGKSPAIKLKFTITHK